MIVTPFVLFLTQLGIMLAFGLVFGRIVQRLGFPAIFGELAGGIILGPTVIGAFFPELFAAVFPSPEPGGPNLNAIRQSFLRFGLLLFMFLAGLEIKLEAIAQRPRQVIACAVAGLLVPFGVGYLAVAAFPAIWGPLGESAALAPVVASILTITALPVIARVLMDLGLLRTDMGTIVVAAGALIGLVDWTAFAVIVGIFSPTAGNPTVTIVAVVILLALVLTVGVWAGRRVAHWLDQQPVNTGRSMGWTVVVVLFASALTELIGIEAIFGAFLLGITLAPVAERVFSALRTVVGQVFSPLFFVGIGIGVNFAASFDLVLVAYVFAIACLGKIVGVGLGGLLGGVPARQSWAVAFGMNARGAVGIILATTALNARLIDQRIFIALVVMALATSLMAGPVIQRILGSRPATANTTASP